MGDTGADSSSRRLGQLDIKDAMLHLAVGHAPKLLGTIMQHLSAHDLRRVGQRGTAGMAGPSSLCGASAQLSANALADPESSLYFFTI